jgi:WD40 repeat protein
MPVDRRRFLKAVALSPAVAQSLPGWAIASGNDEQAPTKQARTDSLGDPLPSGAIMRLGTTRMRHQGYVDAVALSPDGKQLASAGHDWFIRIWDVASGKQFRAIQTEAGFQDGLAYSTDGNLLAAGNNDAVHLFDGTSGHLLYSLKGDKGAPVLTLAFSPDGRLLATGTGRYDKAVHLWSLPPASNAKERRRLTGPDGDVRSLAFAPDGRTLATCFDPSDFVIIWDVATGKELWRAEGPRFTRSVAFASDGQLIAAAGDAGPIHLYKAATGKPVPVPYKDAVVVAFSPNGKALALGRQDATVRLWDPTSGKDLLTLRRHGSEVTSVAFNRNGKTLASGSSDGSLALWDLSTGKGLHTYPGHNYQVMSVAFAPDGKSLASRGGDHTVRVWHTATGQEWYRLDLATPADYKLKTPYSIDKNDNTFLYSPAADYIRPYDDDFLAQRVAYSPDGKLIAAPGLRQSIHIWEAPTGKHFLELRGHARQVGCVAFSPDARLLASGDRAGIIFLWDTSTGKQLRRLEWRQFGGKFREQVLALAFSPDSGTIAVGCSNKVIRAWDIASRNLHPKEIPFWGDSLAFLPDCRTLVALELGRDETRRGEPGTIYMLDVPTGSAVGTIRGDRGIIRAIALSPDGKLVASAGETDRTVRVWEVASGQQILCFKGHENAVLAVAFSPDGKTLASASRDTTLLLWNLLAGPGATTAWAGKPLSNMALDSLWHDLAIWDGARAYQAVCRLVASPDQTVACFSHRLRPAPPTKGKPVSQLVSDLDADQFAKREAAVREIRARGDLWNPCCEQPSGMRPPPRCAAS